MRWSGRWASWPRGMLTAENGADRPSIGVEGCAGGGRTRRRATPSTSTLMTVHNPGLLPPSSAFGNAAQKGALPLRAMAAGDGPAASVLTEPGAGSDAAVIRLRARREGDDYVLGVQFIATAARWRRRGLWW